MCFRAADVFIYSPDLVRHQVDTYPEIQEKSGIRLSTAFRKTRQCRCDEILGVSIGTLNSSGSLNIVSRTNVTISSSDYADTVEMRMRGQLMVGDIEGAGSIEKLVSVSASGICGRRLRVSYPPIWYPPNWRIASTRHIRPKSHFRFQVEACCWLAMRLRFMRFHNPQSAYGLSRDQMRMY